MSIETTQKVAEAVMRGLSYLNALPPGQEITVMLNYRRDPYYFRVELEDAGAYRSVRFGGEEPLLKAVRTGTDGRRQRLDGETRPHVARKSPDLGIRDAFAEIVTKAERDFGFEIIERICQKPGEPHPLYVLKTLRKPDGHGLGSGG